jgi:hypothetical protein
MTCGTTCQAVLQGQPYDGKLHIFVLQYTTKCCLSDELRLLLSRVVSLSIRSSQSVPLAWMPQPHPRAGNSSIGSGPEGRASFSFVGFKGPNGTSSAPFKLAPPTNVVLNNLYCWQLSRPSASTATAAAGAVSSNDGSPALGRAAATASSVANVFGAARDVPAAVSQPRQVAVAQLRVQDLPQQLLVEYLPVAYLPKGLDSPAYFYFE